MNNDVIVYLVDNYDFKTTNNSYLAQGLCPECGERELWWKKGTHTMRCNRQNNCGWHGNVRNLHPELFKPRSGDDQSYREKNTKAARYYLQKTRGIDPTRTAAFWTPGVYKTDGGEWVPTVRFKIDETTYFERFTKTITNRHGKQQKSNIRGSYAGKAWVPDTLDFKSGDQVIITEGCLCALSWLEVGQKAIASLSANNIPRKTLEKYSDMQFTWLIALDPNKAGLRSAAKLAKVLEELKQRYSFILPILPGRADADWNDLHRAGVLTADNLPFFQACGRTHFSQRLEHAAAAFKYATYRDRPTFPYAEKVFAAGLEGMAETTQIANFALAYTGQDGQSLTFMLHAVDLKKPIPVTIGRGDFNDLSGFRDVISKAHLTAFWVGSQSQLTDYLMYLTQPFFDIPEIVKRGGY